ncbi:hypothetical protein MASR2M78_03590 [Treponema sp.]
MEEDSLISWDFKVREPADEGILSTYGKASATAGGAQDPMAISHLGHQALFLSCIESLRRRGKVTVDGTEGSRAVTLIEAIYKSAREKGQSNCPERTKSKQWIDLNTDEQLYKNNCFLNIEMA